MHHVWWRIKQLLWAFSTAFHFLLKSKIRKKVIKLTYEHTKHTHIWTKYFICIAYITKTLKVYVANETLSTLCQINLYPQLYLFGFTLTGRNRNNFLKNCSCFNRTSVDVRRIRINKNSDTNLSGIVWTGPE